MDLDAAKARIVPCDMERPYAFISYSSCDAEVVLADVQTLQSRGYNIWIDVHLDKNNPSWREDAYSAIENLNCEVVVYYVSRSALFSAPCLEELRRTRTEKAKARHLGREVPLLVVEAESIGNMVRLSEQLQDELRQDASLASREKNTRAETLYQIRTEFLNDNDRVRIRARAGRTTPEGYYGELERDLGRSRQSIRLSDQRLYRNAVDRILMDEDHYAQILLRQAAPRYVPAALMLAYLYGERRSGLYRPGPEAEDLIARAEALEPASQWQHRAAECRDGKLYTEALAYYLGDGLICGDGVGMFRASQMWIGKGSRRYALACLAAARELGNQQAIQFYGRIERASEEAIKAQAFRDEACVN